jgi:hypothetical protein
MVSQTIPFHTRFIDKTIVEDPNRKKGTTSGKRHEVQDAFWVVRCSRKAGAAPEGSTVSILASFPWFRETIAGARCTHQMAEALGARAE